MDAVRRNSSEYSGSDGRSVSSCIVKQDFTKQEKAQGRSKVYGLILTDPYALSAILPALLTGAIPVFTFFFLGTILNELTLYSHDKTHNPMPEVSNQCLFMFAVTMVVMCCNALSSGLWIKIGSRVSTKLKDEIFTHIMTYDVAFYDTHSIGGLLTILGEDTAVIQECFGIQKGLQIQQLGQFVVGFICTMVYSWRLGLILLAVIPVVVVVMLSFHPIIHKNAVARFKHIAATITIAEETISAIRTVRGYNREEADTARFEDRAQKAAKFERNIGWSIGSMFFVVMTICWGFVLGILYYSSTLVGTIQNGKEFQMGTMFSCFGFSMMGCIGIVMLENSVQAENRAIVASARVISLTSYQPSINFEGGIKYDDFKGHIKFTNVSFCYPTRNVMALTNVTFEVNPGEIIALVGHSGSGKSTCVQLIERYYDVTEGIITIDGYDIKEIDPRWLHRKIALVSQEPMLFEGTVRKNVLYGVEEKLSDDQVWAALEIANAKKFVTKFDNQLNQIIGDKGSTVSGGQRQRIAIARAVIKDPVILMTDEATSALDSESEKKVQNALDKILATRTGVVVAHRLTTIRNATRIYVFDAGKIEETGTHDELVAKGKIYYNLVKRQLQQADVEKIEQMQKAAKEAEGSDSSSHDDKPKTEEKKEKSSSSSDDEPEPKKEEKKEEPKPEEKKEEPKPEPEKEKSSSSSDEETGSKKEKSDSSSDSEDSDSDLSSLSSGEGSESTLSSDSSKSSSNKQ